MSTPSEPLTQQGDSWSGFRVDYLKPPRATGFYYPDWAAVQETSLGEVHWIIETKGRVWKGTLEKDAAAHYWCEQVSALTGKHWKLKRVNQADFELAAPVRLAELN